MRLCIHYRSPIYCIHPRKLGIKIIDTMQLFRFNSDKLVKSRFFHFSVILAESRIQ